LEQIVETLTFLRENAMSTEKDKVAIQPSDIPLFEERCEEAFLSLGCFLDESQKMSLAVHSLLSKLENEKQRLMQDLHPDEHQKFSVVADLYKNAFLNFIEGKSALEWKERVDTTIECYGDDATAVALSQLKYSKH
jgi:hypothetical protein